MSADGWERDEWWSAVQAQSEMSRAAECGHDYSSAGICRWCGDDEPRRDRD